MIPGNKRKSPEPSPYSSQTSRKPLLDTNDSQEIDISGLAQPPSPPPNSLYESQEFIDLFEKEELSQSLFSQLLSSSQQLSQNTSLPQSLFSQSSLPGYHESNFQVNSTDIEESDPKATNSQMISQTSETMDAQSDQSTNFSMIRFDELDPSIFPDLPIPIQAEPSETRSFSVYSLPNSQSLPPNVQTTDEPFPDQKHDQYDASKSSIPFLDICQDPQMWNLLLDKLESFVSPSNNDQLNMIVSIGVIYTDGSTNCRERNFDQISEKDRRHIQNSCLGYLLCITQWKGPMPYIRLDSATRNSPVPLENRREFLFTLLKHEHVTKVIFDSKSALKPLLNSYNQLFISSIVDPKIGAWVFNPDMRLTDDFGFLSIVDQIVGEHAAPIVPIPDVSSDVRKSSTGSKIATKSEDAEALDKSIRQSRHIPFFSSVCQLSSDLLACLQLHAALETELKKKNLWQIFVDQEMQIPPILALMEIDGVYFDKKPMQDVEQHFVSYLKELTELAKRVSGVEINLGSPKQVASVLFQHLNLTVPKDYTRPDGVRGTPTTTDSVLRILAKQHPLPEIVLRYRKVAKYLGNWIQSLNFQTSASSTSSSNNTSIVLLNSTWSQTRASTGRIISHHPNLQTIPRMPLVLDSFQSSSAWATLVKNVAPGVFSNIGNLDPSQQKQHSINIRDSFKAREGHILVAADYSQLEFRILAHTSNDDTLIDFFNQNKDIHSLIAQKIRHAHKDHKQPELTDNGQDETPISDEERQRAKRLVYGILYGMGPISLADHMQVGKEEAKEFLKTFLNSFPSIQRFIEGAKQLGRSQRFVRTLFGRRRLLNYSTSQERDYEWIEMDQDDSLSIKYMFDEEYENGEGKADSINGAESYLKDVSRPDRQAVNTIIQGTASDIVKKAMINIDKDIRFGYRKTTHINGQNGNSEHQDHETHEWIRPFKPSERPRLVLQIHDELVYECKEEHLDLFCALLSHEMEKVVKLAVPLKVNVYFGKSWGSMNLYRRSDSDNSQASIMEEYTMPSHPCPTPESTDWSAISTQLTIMYDQSIENEDNSGIINNNSIPEHDPQELMNLL